MLFLQFAGAKVQKFCELQLTNHEIFLIHPLIFNDLYEKSRDCPALFYRFSYF
jgi:hypothetical protein